MRYLILSLLLATVGISTAADKGAEPKKFATPTEAINYYIRDGYAKAKIASPAGRATDHEFLRRAYIDIVGRIATVDEVLDYERDTSGNKRARLISRLLHEAKYTPKPGGQPAKTDDGKPVVFSYTDEYAEHWANLWTVWLMTRSGHHTYRDQMKTWLENEFLNGTNHRDLTVKLLTATGKSNQNGAVNFIIHHLGEANPNEKRSEYGPFDAVPVTSRVTRLFLGIQTNCTQCHDHPFNKEWVQADFWGVNAYFRQTTRDRTPTGSMERRMTEPVQITLSDDEKYNTDQIISYERRDGRVMASRPNFLKDLAVAESGESSSKPMPSGSRSRRQVLAEYVTGHDNFARAFVNRMWGHFFGRGFSKEPSVDDFGSHNEIVHPELLDYLAKEFAKYNYDQKKLIEWICTSEVYSLSHVANPAYVDAKYDAYFARMPLKAMSPEVLYESLTTATNAKFTDNRDERRNRRQTFEEKLVANFGDDEGNEVTFNGTVVQALLMMNGPELNNELIGRKSNGPIQRIIARHSKNGAIASSAVIDEIFMAVLNRHPKSDEMNKINALMARGARIEGEKKPAGTPAAKDPPKPAAPPPKGKGNPRKNLPEPAPSGPRDVAASGPNDPTFYADLFWALLNTNEFMLNH